VKRTTWAPTNSQPVAILIMARLDRAERPNRGTDTPAAPS